MQHERQRNGHDVSMKINLYRSHDLAVEHDAVGHDDHITERLDTRAMRLDRNHLWDDDELLASWTQPSGDAQGYWLWHNTDEVWSEIVIES